MVFPWLLQDLLQYRIDYLLVGHLIGSDNALLPSTDSHRSSLFQSEVCRFYTGFTVRPAKGYLVHVGNRDERKAVENTDIELLSYFKLLFQEDIVKI